MVWVSRVGRPIDAAPQAEAWATSWTAGALRDLRAAPAPSWPRFLGRAWQRALGTARDERHLTRAWALESAALIGVATIAAADRGRARRALWRPALAVCLTGIGALDGFVHLGLNRTSPGAPPFATLGPALALTHLRGACAALLLADLVTGRSYGDRALRALVVIAGLSDLLDGPLARRLGRATDLGRWHDAAADGAWTIAILGQLAARGRIPRWLPPLALARFALPLFLGARCYFGRVEPALNSATGWGRLSGATLAALIGVALFPPRAAPLAVCLRQALTAATSLTLVAAALAQAKRVMSDE